jgi:circadian clock protein KaiB
LDVLPVPTPPVSGSVTAVAAETAALGKLFAIPQQRMDDTSFVYWPDSPDGPGCEPEDIPCCERPDIDTFLDRMLELTGETRRRRLQPPASRHVPSRHKSDDAADPPPKIDLVLYTSAASAKSQKALRAVREVLAQYVSSQVKFSTCDLSTSPQDAEADSVVFTPTLVKQGPGPRTSIIGNLDQEEILKDLLDASGVDRRRWDD